MALHKHRFTGALAAVALLGSVATVSLAGTASAAPVQTTTMSVVPTPSVVVSQTTDGSPAQSTTLLATVTAKPIGGLLITPSGKVTFTAIDAYGDTLALGSKNLGVCFLTLLKCTASLSTNAFYVANADQTTSGGSGGTTWTVTASYPGQTLATLVLAGPSSNTTEVTAITGNSSSGCTIATGCFDSFYNADGTASISVEIDCTSNCGEDGVMRGANAPNDTINAPNATAPYTVDVGFGAPNMTPCPNTPDDSMGVSQNAFVYWPAADVTASDPASVNYSLYGASADAQVASPNDPTSICYSQTAPFTQAGGSPAVINLTTNEYEGIPATCANDGNVLPCSQPYYYYNGGGGGGSIFSITVDTDTDPGTGRH